MRKLAVVVLLVVGAVVGVAGGAEAQPAPEATLTGITQLSVAPNHACFRLSSGQVRCAGWNTAGQLGDGSTDERHLAVPVENAAGTAGLTGVAQVVTGNGHSCARLSTGQVRCWGSDTNDALGNGPGGSSLRPVRVVGVAGTGSLTDVTQISSAGRTSCARLGSGQVRCWGENSDGQLGNGSTGPVDHPVVVKNPAGTSPLTGVAQVAVGSDGTVCARLTNGQARCWGFGVYGSRGDGTETLVRPLPAIVKNPAGTGALTGVSQIAVGPSRACAVLETGQARCWGANFTGGLGNGTQDNSSLPVVVRAVSGPGPLTNVTQIAIGGSGSLSGGSESYGGHTCALVSTGGRQVRCWGKNSDGQLGTGVSGTELARRPVVVQRPDGNGALTGATQIASAYKFTCVRLTTGQARCWGVNDHGQQSFGDSGNVTPLPRTVRF